MKGRKLSSYAVLAASMLAMTVLAMTVSAQAQIRENAETKELDRLQAHILQNPQEYFTRAQTAQVNPGAREQSSTFSSGDSMGHSYTSPHLLTDDQKTYVIVVLGACRQGEYGAYCRQRILLFKDASPSPLIVTDEDAAALSAPDGSVTFRIGFIPNIVDFRVNGEKQILTAGQLIQLLRQAQEAGEIQAHVRKANEDLGQKVSSLEKELERLREIWIKNN